MKEIKTDRIPDGIEKALALILSAYVIGRLEFLIRGGLYFINFNAVRDDMLIAWFFSWASLSLMLFIYLTKRTRNEVYYFASFLPIIYVNYFTVVSLPNYFDIGQWSENYTTIINPDNIPTYHVLRVIIDLIYLLIPYFLLQKDTRDWIFKKEQ